MDGREFEEKLEWLMKQDLSAGTEAFCDKLLSRCLSEIVNDDDVVELEDADMDMLAAAGDPTIYHPLPLEDKII